MKIHHLDSTHYLFGNKGALWSKAAHIANSGDSLTLCGTPMLSSNWIAIEEVTEAGCEKCIEIWQENSKPKNLSKTNRLIAEFEGLKPVECFGRYSISKDHCTSNNESAEDTIQGFSEMAKYSTDWSWLMPVVQLCKERKVYGSQRLIDNIDNALTCDLELDKIYDSVVEFIKYYNDRQEFLNSED